MAITAYTGPPGAGKSHALVREVIVPAVMSGRRVVSNIDGLNPDAIRAYCLERDNQWKVDHADKLGQVVLFHGEDSQLPGFFPTEENQKRGDKTVVRGGDLLVFDEWAMFYPNGIKTPATEETEKFLRWHRHMTSEEGVAIDVAIATQSISDFHRRHRPLITRSYLFKKLSAVGADGSYTWHVYDGRLQKTSYATGHGKYDPQIFPLYASSAAAGSGNHTELKTNKKESIWSDWKVWAFMIAGPLFLVFGGVMLWSLWSEKAGAADLPPQAPVQARVAAPAVSEYPPSDWRIVGHIQGVNGMRVVVSDNSGTLRYLKPIDFEFENGRPVSGIIDGKRAIAEQRLPSSGMTSSLLEGMKSR